MSDEQLHFVIAEYLEAEDAGRAPDRREFIARHPEIAAELAAFFANQDAFDHRAEPLGPTRPAARRANGEVRTPFWRSPGEPLTGALHSDVAARRFGDYELLEEIARGGMGVVFKARHIGLGRVVGLKMILAGPLASPADLDRFRLEAQASAMLDHPNLVPTYEVGECDGQPYFTMKFVDGCSLADRLADWKNDPRAVARMVATIARSVHYAHQRGILHRDLKPANILLDAAGEPHVTDFGLARSLDAPSELTQTGAVLGTPSYMAPEQAAGSKQPVTTGSDVYSLGAILYAMITGRPPFRAETAVETLRQVAEQEPDRPSRVHRGTDRDLETICLKCLEKDVRRRYGSAEALADDLDRWLAHRPILARRASVTDRMSKWARRHPALAGLVTVTVLAALAVSTGNFWYSRRLEVEIHRVDRERQQAQWNAQRAESERGRAEQREQEAQRHLFAANMSLAQRAADDGEYGRAVRMLHTYRSAPNVADLRGFEWHYLWQLCRRGHMRAITSDPVRAIAFTTDGKSLLAGAADGCVRLFDPETGSIRTVLEPAADAQPREPIRSIAVTTDGQRAAFSCKSSLQVWDLTTCRLRYWRPTSVGYDSTTSLAFSPDGRILAERYDSGVRLRDAQSGEEVGILQGPTAANAVAFSPDGRRLAAVNNHRTMELWDVADRSRPRVIGQHSSYALSVAFSPDGDLLATGSADGVVKLWNGITGELIEALDVEPGEVYGLAFSPDNEQLAWAGENGTVRVRRFATRETRRFGHAGPVYSVAFASDGRLAAAGHDGIHLWNVQSRGMPDEVRTTNPPVHSVAISPDGRIIASGSNKTVSLWDARSGEALEVLEGHTGMVMAVAFSPDGSLLASGNTPSGPQKPTDERGVIRLWDMATRQLRTKIPAHADSWGLAFSRDGRTLATSGYTDKTIKLWDVESARCVRTLVGHPLRLFCVAIAPDGRSIASGSAADAGDELSVFVWDPATGKPKWPPLQEPWTWAVAFSPDSRLLATAHDGGAVKLRDVATGQLRLAISGHSTAIRGLAFSPDGKTLATGSDDRTIKLWDIVTGDERVTLRGHTGPVGSLAFSRDGNMLVSGGWDGVVRIWRAAPTEKDEQPAEFDRYVIP